MKGLLKNLLLFKLGWIACVAFAASGQPMLSLLAVAIVVALHLAGVPLVVKEAVLLASAAVIGLIWESILVSAGLLIYPGYTGMAPLAPYWIVAMWVLFATTINFGLSWAKKHWAMATVAGLVGGPMAFYAGSAMGAVQFSDTTLALAVIGIGWAVLLPLLIWVSDTIIDGAWLEPTDDELALRVLPIFEREVEGER